MEENLQEQSSGCPVDSKKCCTKGIIIVIVCSLICFFLGYYFGNKSNSNINRAVGSGINRPFTPNIPRLPKGLPNVPNPRMQRPPVNPQNLPKPMPAQMRQRPMQQQPQTVQRSNTQTAQQQSKPASKKTTNKK